MEAVPAVVFREARCSTWCALCHVYGDEPFLKLDHCMVRRLTCPFVLLRVHALCVAFSGAESHGMKRTHCSLRLYRSRNGSGFIGRYN